MRRQTNFYEEDSHFRNLFKKYANKDLYGWADQELMRFGERCATDIDQRAVHTDREGQPKLIKYNQLGDDISEVWVNDGYKKTVQETYNSGIVGYIHKQIPELGKKGDYFISFAQGYLLSQAEPGFYCPVTLTMATAYLLDHYANEEVKSIFLPHVTSTGEMELYEGATFLTERQGGSDVGANETKAVKVGKTYRLYGEKYFASNAGMCGVAMVLARMEGSPKGTKGLSLFAVPWRDDNGRLNGIRIRRLKDKLGVRAVPSAEVEFDGAEAYLVGDESKGIHYMMEALNLSRLCNAVASIGIMRRAYTEAKNYALYREAFGKQLTDYPMIKETLVHLVVKQEIETSAVFSLVKLFDRVMMKKESVSDKDQVMNRLLIALLKKESAEQAIQFSHEAIEIHGGNGFIEDFVTPRLLRDAQVLTVWEGTANILGLEILRLIDKYQAHRVFINEMEKQLTDLGNVSDRDIQLVEKGIEDLRNLSDYALSKSKDVQSYHSKRIAKLMVNIYESIIAIKEASDGCRRNQLKAEIFIEKTWRENDWIDQDLKSIKYFDEIVLLKDDSSLTTTIQ
ncbi:alkylation response protein AidB-like acyl-CoA dehydrogenase [Bacillus pakistanensis]|uniref:Alkylation response protein AidB-like acyl-CoA dehydrogenase n=1 Tax=Rossellomorea pakistanensis TaxID=992288 RepID=A0ABS2N7Z9_9BACI|nr:acyl-CoA dehydrogenase family protein [Bacillus pakistanensis]MBM7583983.1 alkylation response protein AidB-like acyl-CoA dehydrogenase [Bacillus pakistanensis]